MRWLQSPAVSLLNFIAAGLALLGMLTTFARYTYRLTRADGEQNRRTRLWVAMVSVGIVVVLAVAAWPALMAEAGGLPRAVKATVMWATFPTVEIRMIFGPGISSTLLGMLRDIYTDAIYPLAVASVALRSATELLSEARAKRPFPLLWCFGLLAGLGLEALAFFHDAAQGSVGLIAAAAFALIWVLLFGRDGAPVRTGRHARARFRMKKPLVDT